MEQGGRVLVHQIGADLGMLNLVKMCNGSLVLGSSQFYLLPNLTQKFKMIKNSQNWLKYKHLATLI